jgi:CBS domain containing-hemolysin-like protein
MDDTDKPLRAWWADIRIGNDTYARTLTVLLMAVFITMGVAPFILWASGMAWLAAISVILLQFFLLILFRDQIFGHIYRNQHNDADAALLEYLVQQNPNATPGEEEVEMELLENALHLKQVRAKDCMAPRNEIVYADVHSDVETLRQQFIESKLSRILVTEEDLDKVLGYVHVQQLFNNPQDIRSMVMPIRFVPETIPVNDLLHKFIKNRTNIACVVDEYGSLAGLVTLEDVLEQLFGRIDDEHDQEEFIEAQIDEHEFLFSGRLDIQHINEKYPSLALPTGDYNTLSGYLVSVTQMIPEQGARLELDGKVFMLELVSDRKIETVRVINAGRQTADDGRS